MNTIFDYSFDIKDYFKLEFIGNGTFLILNIFIKNTCINTYVYLLFYYKVYKSIFQRFFNDTSPSVPRS